MTTSAVIMMIVMLSLVWGGFALFLLKAWRIEEKKQKKRRSQS